MASTALVYSELRDVEAHCGLRFGAEEQPNNVEAMRIIERVAFEINGVLKATGYTLPITNADDRQFLAHYNTIGASFHCWYAAVQTTDTFPAVENWREDYNNFLAMLREGALELPNTDPATGGANELVSVIIDRVDGYSEEADKYDGYQESTVIYRIV